MRVHATFVALVALIAIAAASNNESVAAALGWLVLLFGSVVVHELAHSTVARAKGIEVAEIDLLPIGGISQLKRAPSTWQDETAISVAGPLASIGLAFFAAAIAFFAGLPLQPALFGGPMLVRLVWANLVLAGFNVLPIFPLDGGRILRAQLERRLSCVEATHLAAQIGRVAAIALISIGLAVNVGLVLIGIFVIVGGWAEEGAALRHDALGPVPAETAAISYPLEFGADVSASSARAAAEHHVQPAYSVIDEMGALVGSVTPDRIAHAKDDELLRALAAGPRVVCGTSLEDVIPLLADGPVAVVTERDRVVGYVTAETIEACLRSRLVDIR